MFAGALRLEFDAQQVIGREADDVLSWRELYFNDKASRPRQFGVGHLRYIINVKIIITYKTCEGSPQTLTLTPEEYFDTLDSDESYENDGIPNFDHAREYLNLEPNEVDWTELHLIDTKETRIIRSDFYGGGKTIVHQRKDFNGYEELIIMTQFSETKTHIVRLNKKDKDSIFWRANYNGIIEDLVDGSQQEETFLLK